MFGKIRDAILDLIFPPICILCKNTLPPADRLFQICQSCRHMIEPNRPPFCYKCSRPLRNATRGICLTCEKNSPVFDQAWGALIYTETSQKLIHLYKYSGKTALRHYFKAKIIDFINTFQVELKEFDTITPIPLHPLRLRYRGYNQSLLLAQGLSRSFSIPLAPELLQRCRYTATQSKLTQKERWTNISGAFRIKPFHDVKNKNILLVDDLYTTGATGAEASRVLKAAGAVRVCLLSAAIARYEKEHF